MRPLAAFACTLVVATCAGGTEPEAERLVVGTVAFYGQRVVVEVPDTVARGEPFPVSVWTYGGGCERRGPTEASVEGASALVVPRDFTQARPGIACPDVLKVFRHAALVTLEVPGEATVTVRGRREPEDRMEDFARAVWVR